MKEISFLSKQQQLEGVDYRVHWDVMVHHNQIQNILFTLLTTDFCLQGPSKTIEFLEAIKLLKHVTLTLTNLTCEFIFCHQLFKNFNALDIVKELLQKFFMTDYLKIETFVEQR